MSDTNVLNIAISLADASSEIGIYKQAVELYEKLLSFETKIFGSDHPEVAITLAYLGNAHQSLGDSQKAKELYERALVIEEKHFGPDHPEVAVTLVNLGNAYRSLGESQKAKEHFERALVIQEKHFGPDNLRKQKNFTKELWLFKKNISDQIIQKWQ